MPKVIFHTDFFDNNRRYRTGVEYDISDDVTLPTRGLEIQEEEKKPKRARAVAGSGE
tara:strand:- start:5554 stop:5724 length:171 start_codon:yes stop_codon:yes gene_type:complete